MSLAIAVKPLVRLLQQLCHAPTSAVLRGHIVLDVRPEPFDGLYPRQVWWCVEQLMTILLKQLRDLRAIDARVLSQILRQLCLEFLKCRSEATTALIEGGLIEPLG